MVLTFVVVWCVLSAAVVVMTAALCASGRHEDHLLGYEDRRLVQTPVDHPVRRREDNATRD